jgi:sulfotransferase family protein
MNFVYPKNWGTVGTNPEFAIHVPQPSRTYRLEISQIVNESHIRVEVEQPEWLSSRHGFIRLVRLSGLQNGNYIINLFETRFNRLALQSGFVVDDRITLTSLASSLDIIELLYGHCPKARYLANGIGKSGTTWLSQLLGSLPGCHPVDMSAAGLSGINHRELATVPLGGVYHGHLPYGFEVVEALDTLGYHNVHVCRDLRDVVVSEYFHKFVMAADQFSRAETVNFSKDELLTAKMIYSWSSSIYQARNVLDWKADDDCSFVRYEDLLSCPVTEFEKICLKLRLPIDAALATYIVETNEFSFVTRGRKPGVADPSSPLRNGLAGDWRNHLSEETSRWFVARHLTYYQALHYI